MNTTDKKIADVLAQFGEPMAGNVWRVQGNAVIYHKALERIAAQARISFGLPLVLRQERDEAVLLVAGHMGERAEWSIGEALLGVNYRVSGKQAAYVYAMAEKRAKDRVILKLIELHGLVYSEEEADDFKAGRPRLAAVADPGADAEEADDTVTQMPSEKLIEEALRRGIANAKSINAVTDFMLSADTQRSLQSLPEGLRDEIRDAAKARLVALGWPSKRNEPPARTPHEDDDEDRIDTGQAPWHTLRPSQQAGIRSKTQAFWRFAGVEGEEAAIRFIYERCKVSSRRELLPETPAGRAWRELDARYEQWLRE